MYPFYDNIFLGCMSSQGLKSRPCRGACVLYMCEVSRRHCLWYVMACGMSWLVDDLWYRCNVVNFGSHISNVVGYCMCGMAGDTLLFKGSTKIKTKQTKKNIRPCCEDNTGHVNAIYKLVH